MLKAMGLVPFPPQLITFLECLGVERTPAFNLLNSLPYFPLFKAYLKFPPEAMGKNMLSQELLQKNIATSHAPSHCRLAPVAAGQRLSLQGWAQGAGAGALVCSTCPTDLLFRGFNLSIQLNHTAPQESAMICLGLFPDIAGICLYLLLHLFAGFCTLLWVSLNQY